MKILLNITKYTLIIFIILFFFFLVIFAIYTNKLNYSIPKNRDIEFYDINGELFLNLNNENKKNYVKLNDISKDLIQAFISIEDKNFYTHKGINPIRMLGALLSNLKKGKIVQGASTITQQFARNLYLNNDKKIKRKIDEILIAINLETKYSKDEILEGYLNTIYFDHGIYGVEDASRFYFNKHAMDLTLLEAVTLASIPKGPIYYSPIKNPENNKNRRNLILVELEKDGLISKKQLDENVNKDIKIYGKIDAIDNKLAPYFQDLVIQELNSLNIPHSNYDNKIKVYTSLDLKLNQILNNAINKYYPNDSNLQISALAIDPRNGNILSIIGGINYEQSTYNRATLSFRQPGSTIKPFLYYTALENGFTPATTLKSEKTNFYVNGELYSPKNYNDIYANSDITMAYALAVSDNIYAIKTHLFLGTDKLKTTLNEFGFNEKIKNNTSLALGTSEVTLKELVIGYSKIASLGKDIKANCIKRVVTSDGKTIYQNDINPSQKFDESNCYILSETMTNMFDNNIRFNSTPTGASISSKLTSKFAGKSGSTDYDNWIIGFNKNIVLGLWTGYDDNNKILNSETRFLKYIWADVMEKYNHNNNDTWYNKPEGVVSLELNPITGMIAKDNEYKKRLYFKSDNLPFYLLNN